MRGVYKGTIKHLVGKEAALKTAKKGWILAQFEDVTATRSGIPLTLEILRSKPREDVAYDAVGFSWHVFRPWDFDIYGEEEKPFNGCCCVMSESHQNGYRVIIGFNTLEQAQAAQDYILRMGEVK